MSQDEKEKVTIPSIYSMQLVLPSGLNVEEQKRRVSAALFALTGAAKVAGVEVEWGPTLKDVIETHLIDD